MDEQEIKGNDDAKCFKQGIKNARAKIQSRIIIKSIRAKHYFNNTHSNEIILWALSMFSDALDKAVKNEEKNN